MRAGRRKGTQLGNDGARLVCAAPDQTWSLHVELAKIAQSVDVPGVELGGLFKAVADAADHTHAGESAGVVSLCPISTGELKLCVAIAGLQIACCFALVDCVVEVVGAPEELAEQFVRLKAAGRTAGHGACLTDGSICLALMGECACLRDALRGGWHNGNGESTCKQEACKERRGGTQDQCASFTSRPSVRSTLLVALRATC